MVQELRQWLANQDETAIDDAFFENEFSHFLAVDWGEDDADIVEYCANCLGIDSLRAEWRDNTLVIVRDGHETKVPLADDDGDRDVTIRTLNDVLQPDYEIRFLVCSHGSDTAGFIVLSHSDWQKLDSDLGQASAENFITLTGLPNLFTEMADDRLPEAARGRFQRMLERNRKS